MTETKKTIICLIDDSPDVMDAIRCYLMSAFDADIRGFESTAQALSFLQLNSIDILITDIKLRPRYGNSQDLCRAIYEVKKRNPNSTVIARSAYSQDEMQEDLDDMESHFQDFRPKTLGIDYGDDADTPAARERAQKRNSVIPVNGRLLELIDHFAEKGSRNALEELCAMITAHIDKPERKIPQRSI